MTELLTTKEAAAFLKLAVVTLGKWRREGKGPSWTKTGRTVKYRLRDLETFLRKNTVKND
jgi:excisionase family DNA binding protein